MSRISKAKAQRRDKQARCARVKPLGVETFGKLTESQRRNLNITWKDDYWKGLYKVLWGTSYYDWPKEKRIDWQERMSEHWQARQEHADRMRLVESLRQQIRAIEELRDSRERGEIRWNGLSTREIFLKPSPTLRTRS